MSSEFAPHVVCAACGERVVDLGLTACVQDSFGCHLVCELTSLAKDVLKVRPHPEAAQFPFKQGKLACKCKQNLGNIHNNVTALLPVAGLTGHGDYAILKFVDVSFAVTPSETVKQLTGSLLGQAVGFVSGKGGKGGKGIRGQSSSRAVSVTTAHVLQAAGKPDDLQRIREATEKEKRRNLDTTPSVPYPPAPAMGPGVNGFVGAHHGAPDTINQLLVAVNGQRVHTHEEATALLRNAVGDVELTLTASGGGSEDEDEDEDVAIAVAEAAYARAAAETAALAARAAAAEAAAKEKAAAEVLSARSTRAKAGGGGGLVPPVAGGAVVDDVLGAASTSLGPTVLHTMDHVTGLGSSSQPHGASTTRRPASAQLPASKAHDAEDAVAALYTYVKSCGGEISATSGVADFYKWAKHDGDTFKEALRSLGSKKGEVYARHGLELERRDVGSDMLKLIDPGQGARPGLFDAVQSCKAGGRTDTDDGFNRKEKKDAKTLEAAPEVDLVARTLRQQKAEDETRAKEAKEQEQAKRSQRAADQRQAQQQQQPIRASQQPAVPKADDVNRPFFDKAVKTETFTFKTVEAAERFAEALETYADGDLPWRLTRRDEYGLKRMVDAAQTAGADATMVMVRALMQPL